jgi:hypothetical protein
VNGGAYAVLEAITRGCIHLELQCLPLSWQHG